MQEAQPSVSESPKNDVPQGFAKTFGRFFALALVLIGLAVLAMALVSNTDEAQSETVKSQSAPGKDAPAFVPAAPAGYGGTKFN